MTIRSLEFEREYDAPRAVVWDAFVEPVLVGGWLGEARIDPVPGGRYDLEWLGSRDTAPAVGTIREIEESEHLRVTTDVHGDFDIVLTELQGGSRGTSTRLRLTVAVELETVFESRVTAMWATSLGRLTELLRGHPFDWNSELSGSPTRVRSRGTDHA